jgi:serine/threonine-protein kinase
VPERLLGPYRLIDQIAVGGMAEIYRAKVAGVGGFEKLVALKVIHPNYSDDHEFVQMLVDEAKLAVQLQHANIVQTFDLGCVENQYYIAMEMIDGIDLYRLLRRASEKDIEFPFEVAAFIAQEAAQGLDYAHRKRDEKGRPLEIVHRDISPQNILCSFDGEVKIVDFGIAKAARRAKQTAAGVIKGKYYYMSPEQAWGDPIDARTDIFSTGILLYEMLVGQMLYLEEDMDVLLEKVRKAIIAKPSTKRKDVPIQLETLVMKALAKRPQDRFQSAGELATALARFIRARAPDFTRGKLAAWIHTILGDEPTDRNQVRDPKISTAVRRAEIERDQNSLLFKLEDLKKKATEQPKTDPDPLAVKAQKEKNAPAPRKKDQATSPVKMPELVNSFANDYEENDATIVDGTGETLMAVVPRASEEPDEEESTRPMGPSQLRNAITGQTSLDDDPATDFDEPEEIHSGEILSASLADDEDLSTTNETSLERLGQKIKRPPPVKEPRLPGMRSMPGAPPAKPPSRAMPASASTPPDRNAGLYDDSGPLTDESDTPEQDEETSERIKPTLTLKPQNEGSSRSPDPSEEETAVSPPKGNLASLLSASAPMAPASIGPTAPWPPPGPAAGAGISATSGPQLVPLPAGLPVLPAGSSQPNPLAHSLSNPAPGHSGRFLTDAVQSLQPRRSRWMLIVVGGGMLAAAIVAVLTSGSSPPQKGTIEVVSSPAGAEVHVDGTVVSQPTPLVITDVDPSHPHHVKVSKKGHDSWESDVKFEGESRQVRLQAILVPVVAAIEITSTPAGAEAIVDGKIAGLTPTTVSDLSPDSEVVVELRLRGYRVAKRSFGFAGKRKLEVSIPLEKAR